MYTVLAPARPSDPMKVNGSDVVASTDPLL
jgi:hypothetical protein